jgi:hypothetical protein
METSTINFLQNTVQFILILHLFNRVQKLERPITPIEPKTLKELEQFYNEKYKRSDMLQWSELTNEQRVKLFNSSEYLSYKFDLSKQDVKTAFRKTFLFRKIQKFVEWLSRLLA